jgi:hypothetical protein
VFQDTATEFYINPSFEIAESGYSNDESDGGTGSSGTSTAPPERRVRIVTTPRHGTLEFVTLGGDTRTVHQGDSFVFNRESKSGFRMIYVPHPYYFNKIHAGYVGDVGVSKFIYLLTGTVNAQSHFSISFINT